MRAPLAKSGGVNGDPRNTDHLTNVPYPFLLYFFPYPLLLLFLRSPLKFDDLSSISLFLLIVAIRFRVRFLMKNNIRKMGWSSVFVRLFSDVDGFVGETKLCYIVL